MSILDILVFKFCCQAIFHSEEKKYNGINLQKNDVYYTGYDVQIFSKVKFKVGELYLKDYRIRGIQALAKPGKIENEVSKPHTRVGDPEALL